MPIQSVLFNKDYWNILGAHMWLTKHHIYPIKSPHVTKNFIRFRISDPNKYSRIRTKNIGDGVELVIGYK